MNKPKIEKGTIIRTIVLALALINQVLAINGISPIPIAEDQLSLAFTFVATLIAWWKNNSFTANAIQADKFKEALGNEVDGEGDV